MKDSFGYQGARDRERDEAVRAFRVMSLRERIVEWVKQWSHSQNGNPRTNVPCAEENTD